MDKAGLKPLQNLVAGLIVVGMLCCLGLIVHAGQRVNEYLGPHALAVAPDGRLFVASHGKVHVFSAEDKRDEAHDLEPMGASRVPADIRVHPDGRLYVADTTLARLLACDLAQRKCGSHDMGLIGWTPAHLMPGNTFKFSLDAKQGRIYVADNAGQRLLVTDATGKLLAGTQPRVEVIFPNQVESYAPGELTVADTNHNRIVTFDITGDRVGKVIREFATHPSRHSRTGRTWPFGMARLPDGSFWVLVARDGMKDADVMLFDPAGKPRRRMDLGPASDPFAIALWKGSVVVADGRNYRLTAFDPDGSRPRLMRDTAFDAELKELHVRSDAWREHRTYATFAMIALPVIGILVLWRMGVPLVAPGRAAIERPAAALHAPAPPAQLTWIELDPEYARIQSRGLWFLAIFGVVALVALFIIPFAFAPSRPFTPARMASLGLVTCVAALMAYALVAFARIQRRNATISPLGVSAQGVHLRVMPWHGMGQLMQKGPYPWREVYFDGRRIMAGPSMLQVKHNVAAVELFAREPFEREVLSRIPKANYVSASRLGWRALQLSPPMAKIVYALLVIAVLASFWQRF